jgi:hypothetical protein
VAHPPAVPLPSLAPHKPHLCRCGSIPIWSFSSARTL